MLLVLIGLFGFHFAGCIDLFSSKGTSVNYLRIDVCAGFCWSTMNVLILHITSCFSHRKCRISFKFKAFKESPTVFSVRYLILNFILSLLKFGFQISLHAFNNQIFTLTYKGRHGWSKDRATLDHKCHPCSHKHGHVSCQPPKWIWQICCNRRWKMKITIITTWHTSKAHI